MLQNTTVPGLCPHQKTFDNIQMSKKRVAFFVQQEARTPKVLY